MAETTCMVDIAGRHCGVKMWKNHQQQQQLEEAPNI